MGAGIGYVLIWAKSAELDQSRLQMSFLDDIVIPFSNIEDRMLVAGGGSLLTTTIVPLLVPPCTMQRCFCREHQIYMERKSWDGAILSSFWDLLVGLLRTEVTI